MTELNTDSVRMLGIIARYHERNDVWPTESEVKMLTGPYHTRWAPGRVSDTLIFLEANGSITHWN